MKKLTILIMGLVILFSQAKTFATPSLGVATDTGIYSYINTPFTPQNYMKYFANVFEQGTVEGFVIGPSESYLTVFTSYDPSATDIWFLANTGPDNLSITFGGDTLNGMGSIGQVDGYLQKNPYYGVQLPTTGWLAVNDTNYFEKTYYLYTAQIIYAGDYDEQDYFFACADINGTTGLQFGPGQKDDFSPKTTSACDETGKIPEPTTMSLLGLGLIGFVAKIQKRKGVNK